MNVIENHQKHHLRNEIMTKRLAMSPERVHELSQKIQTSLLVNPIWQGKERIGLYSPVKNEVETTLLFMTALEQGSSVFFPRVEQGLQFYEVVDPGDLQKGAWGILEPKHSCTPMPASEALDLIIVPGIVFDRSGHRIGYGKGFYDVVLGHYAGMTVSLAYDFQLIDQIPVQEWDCKVQRIITEVKTYECGLT